MSYSLANSQGIAFGKMEASLYITGATELSCKVKRHNCFTSDAIGSYNLIFSSIGLI